MMLAAAGLVSIAALVWWRPGRAARGMVVIVSIDTLRADRLPAYGYSKGRTPALDAFVRDAVVFDRAYAHAPQTLPSHASLLTGRLPFEHGVRDNLGFSLPQGTPTLAGIFHQAGYATAGFVSSFVLRPETGISQGFSVYDAELPASASDRSPGQVQRGGPATFAAMEKWMAGRSDDRAFVFLHLYEPHKPYAPPAAFRDLADPYDGEVAAADAVVGSLVSALKARGWYDAATIVVTADHGEGLGDHGEEEHGLFLYSEVIHVPLIIKRPFQDQAGTRRSELVQHIDVVPTLLASIGAAPPGGLRGRDLTPVLTKTHAIAPQGVYSEAMYARYHFGWSELRAITDDRYRFIDAPRDELYDLELDPRETKNLAADRAKVAAAMRSGLKGLTADQAPAAPAAVSLADRERLAALGYVGTASAIAPDSKGDLPDPKDKAHILRLYRTAVDHLSAQEFPEGARALRTILDEDPGMTDVWSQYATTLTRMGQLDEAYRAWREVVTRKPDEPSGLLGAASVLMELKRFDEAKTYAELAVARSPAAAHQALANLALTTGRYDEALQQAELAERADSTLPLRAMVQGLIHYNRGEYAAALGPLMDARTRYAKRSIQASDLNYFIGDTLARLERYGEAEPFFHEEMRLYPYNTRPRAGLAMLYAATGRMAQAEQVIAELLKVSPSPSTYKTATDLLTMFGKPERAAVVRAEARARFGR